MTVEELIRALAQYPPDARVVYEDRFGGYSEVSLGTIQIVCWVQSETGFGPHELAELVEGDREPETAVCVSNMASVDYLVNQGLWPTFE